MNKDLEYCNKIFDLQQELDKTNDMLRKFLLSQMVQK
jgi:hypothetical protein